jgi:hypothetical protein
MPKQSRPTKSNLMKKQNYFLAMITLALLIMATSSADARIWRVNHNSNYNGNTLWGDNLGGSAAFPVFKEIDNAVDWGTVNDGDTLHIEGATGTYIDATITKRIVIIGPGYFLDSNPKTSNLGLTADINRIDFNAGSSGSVIIGMNNIYGNSSNDRININTSNITVKRCRMERGVNITTGLNSIVIDQCFFDDTYPTFPVLNLPNSTGYVPPVDFVFNNNICKRPLIWYYNSTRYPIVQCRNNTFNPPGATNALVLQFATTDFSNNILMSPNGAVDISASPGNIAYNIAPLSTQFGSADNNLVIPAITTLFVGGSSTDGYYQVAAGTQAQNSGSDGTDRGAFGGALISSRYTLSGLGAIPVVYKANTTGVVTPSGLPVSIKARSIK